MSQFQQLSMMPADPILGLSNQFAGDERSHKVNLTVGIYCDESGATPTFNAVRKAEKALFEQDLAKTYRPIVGSPGFRKAVCELVFNEQADNIASAYAPGGTGGLRLAAELLKKNNPQATVWVSDPTWGNHFGILAEAGLQHSLYPYQHTDGVLDIDAIIASLENAQAGDAVLLHGCCHNPSGVDPSAEQWAALFDCLQRKQLLPFFDIAYHGFANGQEQDIAAIRQAYQRFDEIIVVYSFSKVMGLYGERTGSVLIKGKDAERAAIIQSNLTRIIRCNYSNPPMHGMLIAETVLSKPDLKQQWQQELVDCAARVNQVRNEFAQQLQAAKVPSNAIDKQFGLFSFLAVSKEQAQTLRNEYAIYLLDSGRINIAGLNQGNMNYVVESLAKVVTA